MKCREARKHMQPMMDNELDTETNLEVLGHLNVCDECQKKYESSRTFQQKLKKKLQDRSAPESLETSFNELVAEKTGRRVDNKMSGTKTGRFVPMAVAATVLLLVGILTVFPGIFDISLSPAVGGQLVSFYRETAEGAHAAIHQQDYGEFNGIPPGIQQAQLEMDYHSRSADVTVPDFNDARCKIIDGKAYPEGTDLLPWPHYYTVYCFSAESKKHLVTYLTFEKENFDPRNLDTDRFRVDRAKDGIWRISPRDADITLFTWWEGDQVYAIIGKDLSPITDLSSVARKAMAATRSSSSGK